MSKWIHLPLHLFNEKGTYMITGATMYKKYLFKESRDLDQLQNLLFDLSIKYECKLEAWALFSNHYHFIAQSPENPERLQKLIAHFQGASARQLNKTHQISGRRVWYQYWDTQITFQNSYLTRLNYVMQNPVKHNLVNCASHYKWSSANWFETHSSKAHYETVISMKTDKVSVYDDF